MDSYQPFITQKLESFIFKAKRYEEFKNGEKIASGSTTLDVVVKPQCNGQIQCLFANNDLNEKLMSTTFDTCISSHDRLLMMSSPQHTNADVPVISVLQFVIGTTCEERYYQSIEPVVGSIFTEQGKVVKLSFTMANPERLIELYPSH